MLKENQQIEDFPDDIAPDTDTYRLVTMCPMCREKFILTLPKKGFEEWLYDDVPIEKALPDLEKADIELLMSGLNSECLDGLFPL